MRSTHAAVAVALDAGVPLPDAQDSMGHEDPRATRLDNRSLTNLNRDVTYAVAATLAGD